MRWQTDDSDRGRFEKVPKAAYQLYMQMGAYLLEQHYRKRDLPDEWLVPSLLIKRWGAYRQARQLVDAGLWRKDVFGMHSGYRYNYILFENTPTYLALLREKARTDKREHRRKTGRTPPSWS